MASSTVNGATKEVNGTFPKVASPANSQSKASFAKMSDSKKNEDDMSQRRTSQPPKAWTTGVNPITQRSSTPQSSGPGSKMSGKSAPQSSTPSSKNQADRQFWVHAASVGAQCTIVTKANETFSGIFAGSQKSNDDYSFLFKMVKKTTLGEDLFQGEYVGYGAEHTMVFPTNSLLSIDTFEEQIAQRGASTSGASGEFRTDIDISGNQAKREKTLQKWEAPATGEVGGALEPEGQSSGEGWDQFKANEKMFGLKSDYDENIYTTTIDKNSPLYAMRERDAARIAREIESSTSGNSHMREERGQQVEGIDEETKYSGVSRTAQDYQPLPQNQPGRYMPPARRQQTVATTAEGSFVDPAIISSQLARPQSKQSKTEVKAEKVEPKAEAKSGPTSEPMPEQKIEKPEAEVEASRPAPKAQPSVATSSTAAPKESKAPKQLGKPSAAENVEHHVLDSFRSFLATEKMRIQDHKRNKASADKAVKLNDLKKFSKNFKLLTPVPKDLVPILAKDEGKQRQIVEKAQRNAEASKERSSANLIDPKSQRPLAVARWEAEGGAPPTDHRGSKVPSAQLQATQLQKGQMSTGKDISASRPAVGLSARLQESHRVHKAMAGVPAQLPLQENRLPTNRGQPIPNAMVSPQKAASLRGPPSATSAKFNVKALEFKPNPTASSFKPSMGITSTAVASPRSSSATRTVSPAQMPAKLFGDKKSFGKWEERPNPINSVAPKKNEINISGTPTDGKPPLPAQNGGFQYPYRTPPTWAPPADGENGEPEMKYYEAFDKFRQPRHPPPPSQTSPINPVAHQHQLPFHLQSGAHPVPQVHTPQQVPHPMHSHPHHFSHAPHFDDHHMRPSASNSSAYPAPSPRMHNPNMAYPSPMPPQPQIYGTPVQYVVSGNPSMGGRQFSNGPPQMIPVPAGHLAPMMVQQPSSGGYMPQPVPYNQVVYATPNPPVYPPAQPPSGYPSPGRGAPMMVHSGSHQGHQPTFVHGQFPQPQPMYPPQTPGHVPTQRGGFGSPQPHFVQQPYQQQHHYPHQPRRTPSTGYAQPHQMHHHVPSQQGPSQMNGAMDGADDGK